MRDPRCLALVVLIGVAGCTVAPDLQTEPVASGATKDVQLVPIGPLLAEADALGDRTSGAPVAITSDLASRASALKTRAARLRGPVIPAATRAQFAAGINTTALR